MPATLGKKTGAETQVLQLSESMLRGYVLLKFGHEVLYEEEQEAYNQVIFQNMREGKAYPLTFIHLTANVPGFHLQIDRILYLLLLMHIDQMLTEEAKVLETQAFRASGSF